MLSQLNSTRYTDAGVKHLKLRINHRYKIYYSYDSRTLNVLAISTSTTEFGKLFRILFSYMIVGIVMWFGISTIMTLNAKLVVDCAKLG